MHIILDPELKHIGFSVLNTNDKWNYGVGIFDFEIANNNESSVNLSGNYNLYSGDIKNAPKVEEKTANPVKSNEISPASLEKLRESIKKAKQTMTCTHKHGIT
ncbi:hypothetical protein ACCQ41_07145 [Anaerococcus sp. ENR0831]|uniref:Uncharacterized protein n=1 Tax=Anaerococcus martiniensis TaxID=3115615 RepID=A0ABW9MC32_9FIRM